MYEDESRGVNKLDFPMSPKDQCLTLSIGLVAEVPYDLR
jgi:hypothetical protein